MTSDAKIGLILGLVFIFIIAFIINGLPGLNTQQSSNELTAKLLRNDNKSLGIAANQRKISRQVINPRPIKTQAPAEVQSKSINQTNIRYTAKLPRTIMHTSKPLIAPKLKHAETKLYTVREGDSLASIASRFYGSVQGNRNINIEKIYQANRKTLKSPDQIYLGQKLVIPALSSTLAYKSKTVVETLSANKKTSAKSYRRYVVKQDDSLWQIADQQLGNGSRYNEIVRLNSNILHNEDQLTLGMKLKLPLQ